MSDMVVDADAELLARLRAGDEHAFMDSSTATVR